MAKRLGIVQTDSGAWESYTWHGKSKYGKYPAWRVGNTAVFIELINSAPDSFITLYERDKLSAESICRFIQKLVNKYFSAKKPFTHEVREEIFEQVRCFIKCFEDMYEPF